MFIIKLRNWIPNTIQIGTITGHTSWRKIEPGGELSLAERSQGRWGNPLARVTLA